MRHMLLAIAAFFVASATSAFAVPITMIDGTVAQTTIVSDETSFTVSFAGSAVTQHNNVLLGTFLPTTFSTVTGDATPISSNGLKIYSLNDPVGVAKSIQPGVAEGGGSADFIFQALTFEVNDSNPNTAVITGIEFLVGDTTAFDYSPFFLGGTVTFTVNANGGVNLNDIIQNGGTAIGSASFSQAAVDLMIPEPSTIAILAVFGVFSGFWSMSSRRRHNKMAKTVCS